MKLGKVIGTVWADQKVAALKGCQLYVIQPTSSDGKKTGFPLVAADPQRIAAPGDCVVYVTSTDAVQAFDKGDAPINAAIVELVESVS